MASSGYDRPTDRQRACSRLRLRPRLRLRLLRVAALLSGRRYRLCLFTTPMPRGWIGLDWNGLQVSKEEFFQYFTTVYLSASDMTAFKED